jgi:hypothetical protein
VWWIADPDRVTQALGTDFLVPCLGWLFLPFTTLIYIILAPVGGPQAFDWVWLGLGVLIDLSMYGGGAYGNRERVQQYYGNQ